MFCTATIVSQLVRNLFAGAANLQVALCLRFPDFCDADTTDLTVGSIAYYLAATDTPHVPLHGLLCWIYKRPFFSIIGTKDQLQGLCTMQHDYMWAV